MVSLLGLPREVLDCIIDHLLLSIGIQKAVLLRTVNTIFSTSIINAICVRQVIDFEDDDMEDLLFQIDAGMKGKIIAVKSRHTLRGPGISYPAVIARLNQMLDSLIGPTDQELMDFRHESVAGAMDTSICSMIFKTIDAEVEAQNLLCGAAVLGDLSIVKAVQMRNQSMSITPNINSRTPFFDRPLTLAAARGHLLVVGHLLECGAQIQCDGRLDVGEYPPKESTLEAQWRLMDEGNRYKLLRYTSPNALRMATRGGHEAVVHLLLRPQCRLPITSFEYREAVVEAARAGKLSLIETLLQTIDRSISDFRGLDTELLWAAICYDRMELVQWLLERFEDIEASPRHRQCHFIDTLYVASNIGRTAIVRFLLKRGADMACSDLKHSCRTPIEGAARHGHQEVVELLIDHGADPCVALVAAAHCGQQRVVRLLLERLPDLPFRRWGSVGKQAMHRAIPAGNLTIITMLANAGVPLNNYKNRSAVPVHYAKACHSPWVVNHLLKLGALDIDDHFGTGPLYNIVRGIRVRERTWDWVGNY